MTRERKAHLATAIVLMVALGIALGQKSGWRWGRPAASATSFAPQATPQDAIYRMLDAARVGNVAAYLECYSDGMRASLEESVRETTEAAFAGYLRDSNSAIKGVALSDPQINGDREATVKVEYVYQDRNEVQIMRLEKPAGQWKIVQVDGADRVKTLIPYGTPVR